MNRSDDPHHHTINTIHRKNLIEKIKFDEMINKKAGGGKSS